VSGVTARRDEQPFSREDAMDLIVDLIDQLIEARIDQSTGNQYHVQEVKIAKLKERLRMVLLENLGR
jgi:hypothetical protein